MKTGEWPDDKEKQVVGLLILLCDNTCTLWYIFFLKNSNFFFLKTYYCIPHNSIKTTNENKSQKQQTHYCIPRDRRAQQRSGVWLHFPSSMPVSGESRIQNLLCQTFFLVLNQLIQSFQIMKRAKRILTKAMLDNFVRAGKKISKF